MLGDMIERIACECVFPSSLFGSVNREESVRYSYIECSGIKEKERKKQRKRRKISVFGHLSFFSFFFRRSSKNQAKWINTRKNGRSNDNNSNVTRDKLLIFLSPAVGLFVKLGPDDRQTTGKKLFVRVTISQSLRVSVCPCVSLCVCKTVSKNKTEKFSLNQGF